MRHQTLVTTGAKGAEGFRDGFGFDQEIGQQDDKTGALNHAAGAIERGHQIGLGTGTGLTKGRENPIPLLLRAARRDHRSDLIVDANQPDRIALANQEERECGGQMFGVGHLGETGVAAAPVHGLADVQNYDRPGVCLLLEQFYHPAIGAGGNFPVEVAEVIAGLVLAVFGELDGEAFARRAVETVDEAVHDPAGHEFEAAEGGEGGGIELVGAGGGHSFVKWLQVRARRPAGRNTPSAQWRSVA